MIPQLADSFVLKEMSYVEAQKMLDTSARFKRRNHWKSIALPNLTAPLVECLAQHAPTSPSTQSFISVDIVHGAAQREPAGGSTYSLRDRPFVVLLNSIWRESQDDKMNVAWCRTGFSRLASFDDEGSTYSNYFSADDIGVQPGSHSSVPDDIRGRYVPAGLLS